MSLINLHTRIVDKFKLAQFRVDKINRQIEEFCQKIIKDIQNSDELKCLLKQRDLQGNDSLYYMSLHNVYSILDTKSTDRIIQDFWKSNIDVNGNLFSASTSYRLLEEIIQGNHIDFKKFNFKLLSKNHESLLKSHNYQYQVWKKSMQVRYFFESVMFLGIAVFFQIYINEFNTLLHTVSSSMDAMDNDPTLSYEQRLEIATEWRDHLETAGLSITTAMYVSCMMFSFPVRQIQTKLFSMFLKRKYNMFKASSIVEIGFSICIIVWISKFVSADQPTGEPGEFDKNFNKLQVFVHNAVEEVSENIFKFDILLAVHTSFLWMKVMLLLKLTRSFGPLLKIIEHMVHDFIYFCIIWGINLIFFTFLGMLLFSEIELFKSFQNTLIMLIQSSLGQWDLTMYDDLSFGEIFGKIYHLVFLIVNLVMLLNLMIAILSTTFTNMHQLKLALYYDEIIEAIPQYKYDKVYGSLICSIPPFNILMLPTSIIYFFIKDKDKLARINSFLVKIAFAPKILLITPIFIAGNALFLPFAYLATVSYLFKQLFSKRKQSFIQNLGIFLAFTIFGLLLLFTTLLSDIVIFLKHLFSRRNEKLSQFLKPQISKNAIRITFDIVQQQVFKKVTTMNSNQVIKLVRDAMHIDQTIIGLIYGDSKQLNDKVTNKEIFDNQSKEEYLLSLKVFNTVKNVIRNCTNDNNITDIKMLLCLLKEVSCKMKVANLNHPFINLDKNDQFLNNQISQDLTNPLNSQRIFDKDNSSNQSIFQRFGKQNQVPIQPTNRKDGAKRKNHNDYRKFKKNLFLEFSFVNPNRTIDSVKDQQQDIALQNQKLLIKLTSLTEKILGNQRPNSEEKYHSQLSKSSTKDSRLSSPNKRKLLNKNKTQKSTFNRLWESSNNVMTTFKDKEINIKSLDDNQIDQFNEIKEEENDKLESPQNQLQSYSQLMSINQTQKVVKEENFQKVIDSLFQNQEDINF
eukprot:403339718